MNIQSQERSSTDQFHYRRLEEEVQYTRTAVHPVRHPFQIQSPVNGNIAAEVILENVSKLVETDAKWLSNQLCSKILLSKPILRKVLESPENLSLALLESSTNIKYDGEKFNDFLSIFIDEPAYKPIAIFLKNSYGECNNNYTCMQFSVVIFTSCIEQKLGILMKMSLSSSPGTINSQCMTLPNSYRPIYTVAGTINPLLSTVASCSHMSLPNPTNPHLVQFAHHNPHIMYPNYYSSSGNQNMNCFAGTWPHTPHLSPLPYASAPIPTNLTGCYETFNPRDQYLTHHAGQLTGEMRASVINSQPPHPQQMLCMINHLSHQVSELQAIFFSQDKNLGTAPFSGTLGSLHTDSHMDLRLVSGSQIQTNTHISPIAAVQNQLTSTTSCEIYSHVSTSTTQSQQYPIHPQITKHTSLPIMSPGKHPEVLFPVLENDIKSQNFSDKVGSTLSDDDDDDSVDKDKNYESRISSFKKYYAEMEYPTLAQESLRIYFDLLIIDTKAKAIINLEDIGVLSDGTQARCVLIEGGSGVGKTMLLHHLAKQWGVGKMLTRYSLLLLFSIETDTIDEYYRFGRLVSKAKQEENILYLVDDIQVSTYYLTYILSDIPQQSSIIFTCHSNWHDHNKDVIIRNADQYLKVLGFTEESMQAVTTSTCLGLEQTFQDWMNDHPFVAALTYRPLYCTMLLHLCRNNRLPNSLPNITELYTLFVLCAISEHVNRPIKYYSDLKGENENAFRILVASSTKEFQTEDSSFGLVKQSRFIHPSIKKYFEALECCTTKEKAYPSDNVFSAGLGKENFFLHFLDQHSFVHYYYHNSYSFQHLLSNCGDTALQLLLFESQCSSPVVEILMETLKTAKVSPPLEFKLEADPLEWFIIGWCLHNIRVESRLICDVPYSFNRALCLEMLYNGTKHNATSNKCKGRITDIILNGDVQLSECLSKLTLIQPITEDLLALKIMGTLSYGVEGLNLDIYYPYLNTLDVTSHEDFSLVWQPLSTSLPKLDRLTTLLIHTSHANTFGSVKSDILLSISSSIKACCALRTVTFDGMSSLFLDSALTISSNDPIASSLQTLYILSSHCSDKLVIGLKSFLALKSCNLKQLIFKNNTISPSCLGNLLNSVLASALTHLIILGNESIGQEGALEIAKAIENAQCKFDNNQKQSLVLHDPCIPGEVVESIITAMSKYQGNITLYLLPRYKYDFYHHENVEFGPDQDVSLILQTLMLACTEL